MLDKNIERILDDHLIQVRTEFLNKNQNIILSSEPFVKTGFLIELIDSIDYPVIFLDFDLLYSGYVVSEMIKKNGRVKIYRPSRVDLKKILAEIAKIISKEKTLIVIDSLNGVYNIIDNNESDRFVNASIMLLAYIGRETGTSLVIAGLVRNKSNLGWILSPGGKRIIDSKKTGIYNLDRIEDSLMLRSIDKNGNILKTFKIVISESKN